jgi:hypothetical protein
MNLLLIAAEIYCTIFEGHVLIFEKIKNGQKKKLQNIFPFVLLKAKMWLNALTFRG